MRDAAPGSRSLACAGKFGLLLCLVLRGMARADSARVTGESGACGLRRGSGRRADSLGRLLYVLSAAPVPPGTRVPFDKLSPANVTTLGGAFYSLSDLG